MNVQDLLTDLTSRGISLRLDNGDLRYSAPKGAMTDMVRRSIRERRDEIINHLQCNTRGIGISNIPRLSTAADYALSHAQQRIWVLSQVEDSSAAYNIPLNVMLEGALDLSLLNHALQEVVGRHESLRTSFSVVEGEPRQIVRGSDQRPLELVDLSSDADPTVEADRIAAAEAVKPFDLETGPLLRIRVLRIEPERHLLLCTMHHIISDGVSIGNFFRELTTVYNARKQRTAADLPDLPVQYRDFASWQREHLEVDVQGHRAYWHSKLSGSLPVLEFPADRHRPPTQTFNGSEIKFSLGQNCSEGLRRLARENQCSLFMVLLTCYKALLHRYTGAEEVIVGSPVAGREHPDLQYQIGLFLNTLPLRSSTQASATFAELMLEVRKTCLEAFEHQAYPFDRIVDDLKIERDLSRSPVFDAMIILQNQDDSPPAFEGVRSSFHVDHTDTSKVDVTLCCKDLGDEIWVNLEYNTDLFNEARMRRMANHFVNLAGSAIADPSQNIGCLGYLTEDERLLVQETWNATDTDYPKERTVVDLIDETASRNADRIAVVADDGCLTYQDLEIASNRLAHRLIGLGVGEQDLVGLCVERSAAMVIALLGILKAGAGYVPLDPHHPSARLRDIVVDANVGRLITTSDLRQTVADITMPNTTIVFLDEERPKIDKESPDRPTRPVAPHQVCYAIYTSGSTGHPKGVVIPHKALVNFLWSMRSLPGLSADDVLLAVTTLTFDIAALELFLPLVTGARLVLASQHDTADANRLSALIESKGITVMQATPATWSMLLEAGWHGKPDLKVLCGGEALSVSLARELMTRSAEAWNLYGPTETTIWSTLARLDTVDIESSNEGTVSIGRPIGNTEIYILDSSMQPVGVGIPGDLYIGGDGLAIGYHGRPDLTNERFVTHPFSKDPNDRLYQTGDLARYRPNGEIEFLGRTDYQVKIRGFRIETAEVEAALLAHSTVQQAVVVAIGGTDGNRLVAYLLGDEPQTNELRAFLRDRIPDYMVPSIFQYVDRFPLTPSRKVDRNALPEPDPDSAVRTKAFVAPQNAVEIKVARIWCEILGVKEIGVHDDFFELGGHSLSATRAVFRLQRDVGLKVELADLFRSPSIDGLIQILQSRPGALSEAAESQRNGDHAEIDEMTAEELALLEG